MTPEQFIYWLQGFLEISQSRTIDATGVDQIRKHLALVLTNVTKSIPNDGRMREIGPKLKPTPWPNDKKLNDPIWLKKLFEQLNAVRYKHSFNPHTTRLC